jgi:hypothetical protein
MMKSILSTSIIGGIAMFLFLGLALYSDRDQTSNNQYNSSAVAKGTSVVVLVDFSKSFPALRRSDGSIVYGLRFEDRRALGALTGTLAELASRYWTPPLKAVWMQIQASSITANPLCDPLETLQKLVKSDGSVGTREEIHAVLNKCVANVIEASKDKSMLGNYTDISGAVAMASDIASGEHDERILVVLSDMHEELPSGTREATFQLNGERVVLLHRPGTDEPNDVSSYLDRVNGWKKKMLDHGAKTVVAMPIFAVSEARLRAALHPQEVDAGTALTILVDFKENVFPPLGNTHDSENTLVRIGKTLSELARNWHPPVTALWMTIGSSAFVSNALPPLEFGPSLIKKENTLNTAEEFGNAMEELARALPSRGRGTHTTDISGTIALSCSVDPPAKSHVLIVISDFVDSTPQLSVTFRLSPGTRVIMVHKASPTDRSDPNAYNIRRHKWEQRFKESGATEVYQFPLLSFTPNDLRSCLGVSK